MSKKGRKLNGTNSVHNASKLIKLNSDRLIPIKKDNSLQQGYNWLKQDIEYEQQRNEWLRQYNVKI